MPRIRTKTIDLKLHFEFNVPARDFHLFFFRVAMALQRALVKVGGMPGVVKAEVVPMVGGDVQPDIEEDDTETEETAIDEETTHRLKVIDGEAADGEA